ncbi:hypothetical protein ACH4S8_44370 [Streptomyces sp. NPDC021080]|uniref:hypothetical protein n=1 Tax=Streptomyces sp. NPDC021080 TaxID=3365110 RepID=UPI0037B27B9D
MGAVFRAVAVDDADDPVQRCTAREEDPWLVCEVGTEPGDGFDVASAHGRLIGQYRVGLEVEVVRPGEEHGAEAGASRFGADLAAQGLHCDALAEGMHHLPLGFTGGAALAVDWVEGTAAPQHAVQVAVAGILVEVAQPVPAGARTGEDEVGRRGLLAAALDDEGDQAPARWPLPKPKAAQMTGMRFTPSCC